MNFTFDPLDPVLLVIHSLWLVVAAGLGMAAYKAKGGWMRAALAGLALAIAGIWFLAILPSWWLYYADGRMGWGGQGCVEFKPIELYRGLTDGAIRSGATWSCLKQSMKDTIVVGQNAVFVGIFVIGFSIWQKKFPKQLAPGEPKPEATGGYK